MKDIITLNIPVRLEWTGSNARVIFTNACKSVRRLLIRGVVGFRVTLFDDGYSIRGVGASGAAVMMIAVKGQDVLGRAPDEPIATVSLWNQEVTGRQHKLCERPAEWVESDELEATDATVSGCDQIDEPVIGGERSDDHGLIMIENDGPRIVDTSYWVSPLAAAGKMIVSSNASHVRLLVPAAKRREIEDGLRGVTKLVVDALPDAVWKPRQFCTHWLFEDESPAPFVLQLSPGAFVDFHPPCSRTVPASVWVSENGRPHCIATLPMEWRVVPVLKPLDFIWRVA